MQTVPLFNGFKDITFQKNFGLILHSVKSALLISQTKIIAIL